jgi:multiple sugar transport system permease protein
MQNESTLRINKKKRMGAADRKQAMWAYLFILPAILGLMIFNFVPLVMSFVAGFTNWTGLEALHETTFVGFEQYARMMSDRYFWMSVGNTLFTMIGIPIGIFLSLLLALLLNRGLKGTQIFRIIFYIPVVCSLVAVTLLWQNLLAPTGPFNKFLEAVNIKGIDWFGHRIWAKAAIVVMCVWKGLGYSTLLYIAGLQGVPKSYYEAAKLDGTNGWQLFWQITFPLIQPTSFFLFVTGIISGAQLFTEAQLILPAASVNGN